MEGAGTRSSVDDIVARLERLPTSWWQVKARIIVGVATFFDAFDALAIASVLPVIVPLWKLTPPAIGLMISAGFLGQLLGALLFGWIAERYGRMKAMVGSIALFALMSLACAFAWDYGSLLVLRTIQGIGLGGEVPVAAVFISELAKAQGRGRFVLLYELVFPVGLVAASLSGLWVVPHLGWQYMFVIGALPALLALVLRSLLPESPRWLAVHGRDAEAEAALSLIENETQKATGEPLPPVKPVVSASDKAASWSDLFGPFYLRRTLVVWVIWFAAYFVNYGLSIWLPTLYRTVFKLPLDVSLRYGLITQAVGLLGTLICALTIDHVGRRPWFAVSFVAAPLARTVAACHRPARSAHSREKRADRRRPMRVPRLVFAILGAAALFSVGAAQAAEPVKIRLSWVAPVTNWASIMLEKKDLARHLGKSYTLEPTRYAGTPPMVTALANGELEIANLAYSTLAITIENAGMADLRIIADEFRDGVEGYYSQEFMVLADGPIKKVEDLKGKIVMTNAAGSAVDVAMRAMLRKFGLEDKRDYTMIESPFPTMRAILSEKKVDLIISFISLSYAF